MTTCIHFISIPDYETPFASISLPMVRAYAQRIGATLNIISQRKFPDFPVTYEVVQIFEAGAAYDWNMHVGAGVLIGETLPDPSSYISPDHVATNITYSAQMEFVTQGNIYFERNERDLGVSDDIFLAHNLNHEVWEPLGGSYSQYSHIIKDCCERKFGSYVISHNMAKYGLKLSGIFPPNPQCVVIQEDQLKDSSVEEFVSKTVKRWRREISG